MLRLSGVSFVSKEDQAFNDVIKLSRYTRKGPIKVIYDDGLSHPSQAYKLMSLCGIQERIILVQSRLGTGKTYQAKRLIPKCNSSFRCIWITSTCVLARETTQNDPRFTNYQDCAPHEDLSKYSRIVTLVPSIHRFKTRTDRYDLVVIDEVESVFEDLQSEICRAKSEEI